MLSERRSTFSIVFILSLVLTAVLYQWQRNKGFSLWDEGFLWYGVQGVLSGDVPIRDFMSYDIGRYYFSAVFLILFGDSGILALRLSLAIVQFVGLFLGLQLVCQNIKNNNLMYMVISGVTLAVWMFSRHKVYDVTLSIILITVVSYLLNDRSKKAFFTTGLCVGLVAVFGRNHAVYGVVACLASFLWIGTSSETHKQVGTGQGIVIWAFGVMLGFSPILSMAVLVPNFGVKFLESIRFLVEIKATNIFLPVPWPWKVDFSDPVFAMSIHYIVVGIFFICLFVYGPIAVLLLCWRRLQGKWCSPLSIATSFLSIPYAHYAYSRADIPHLAHSIFPVLIGILYFFNKTAGNIKLVMTSILCVLSLFSMHVYYPGWQMIINKDWSETEIGGDKIYVDTKTLREVALLKKLHSDFITEGERFLVVPFWPGAYPLLRGKSPTWEIYALFPRTTEFQQLEIDRIKFADPRFVLILDKALDGRDDLRYRNTHPLIYQYIVNNFNRITYNLPNNEYQLYVKLKN